MQRASSAYRTRMARPFRRGLTSVRTIRPAHSAGRRSKGTAKPRPLGATLPLGGADVPPRGRRLSANLSIIRRITPSVTSSVEEVPEMAVVIVSEIFLDINIDTPSYSLTHEGCSESIQRLMGRAAWSQYEQGRKSCSYIASSTMATARCATLSSNVGIPRGRCVPSAFGI